MCLSPVPEGKASKNYNIWVAMNEKERPTIILCPRDTAIAKTHWLVDDEAKTGNDLWNELCKINTSSSTQAITNIQGRLEFFSFKDGEECDKHMFLFLSFIDERRTLDQVVSIKEKVRKLLRPLPASLNPLAMASSLESNNLDKC